jgi:hypothetical protein
MPGTANGYATIKGISKDDACTVTIEGYANVLIDTVPIQLMTDLTEHMGAHGHGPCAMEWRNQRVMLEITFRPASSTSQEDANEKAILIPQGTVVTLSGFLPVTILNAVAASREEDLLNGDWLHVGPTTTLTLNASAPGGEVQLTLGYYFDRQTNLTTEVPATSAP